MKVADYEVVRDNDIIEFERRVTWALNNGWQPLGGVSVSGIDQSDYRFYQAMVKYDEIEIP